MPICPPASPSCFTTKRRERILLRRTVHWLQAADRLTSQFPNFLAVNIACAPGTAANTSQRRSSSISTDAAICVVTAFGALTAKADQFPDKPKLPQAVAVFGAVPRTTVKSHVPSAEWNESSRALM